MNKDLSVGNPRKVIWKFCLPLFGSMIFQQLYNIADSWVSGRYINKDALAAVGNSYEITLIFIAFAFGCNIGCSVITSRYFGAKDYLKMKTAVATSMIASGALCVILMILGFIFGGKLLTLMNTPADLFHDSALYLNIYISGLLFVFFYNIATGIFSALGDAKTPFFFLAGSSISNILVDIFFVKNLSMGVAGVAWATFLCQGVSCLLSVIVVFLRLGKIKTDEKYTFFDGKIFKQFVIIALPSTLQQSFISIGIIIIQGVINNFGNDVMAGYAAGVKLNNLVITSFTTIGNGISNYTSQNIGAKKFERIRPGFKAGLFLVWILCIPICILYLVFPKPLVSFFLDVPSDNVIQTGTIFLRILTPFYFVAALKLIADGVLRGAGLMKQFMIATFTDLTLRVILAYILSSTTLGSTGIWCAWPIGWTIATCISVFFYRTAKWDRAKL